MRVTSICLAFAFCVLTNACNDPGEQKPATPAVTAAAQRASSSSVCTLFPIDELARVLAKPITRHDERSPNRCVFYTDDPLVYVDLEADRQNAAEAWKGITRGNTVIEARQEAVPELGDHAFFGPRERLYVLRGQTFVAIEAGFDANVRDRAKRVAELVLSKAP